MVKPVMSGFQKPLDSGKRVEVRIPIIRTEGGVTTCSCGWATQHRRLKVAEDRAETHLAKKHSGEGIWL